MSLKQSDSVLSLFSFRIPRMSRPILTSFMRSRTTKPPPQIKMSPTPARTTFSIFGRVRSGGTKERCFLSVQSRYRPPMLPRSAYRGIEREDPGPEQVGLGYRAVSAVGGDRGRARTVHSVARLDPRRQSLGCSPNPTRERTGGNRSMGNVRVSSQGSFFVVGHRAGFGRAVQSGAQGSWAEPYLAGGHSPHEERAVGDGAFCFFSREGRINLIVPIGSCVAASIDEERRAA
ncbi:hypothetical protein Sjap_026652 [Stephania japonica]|uniref:Uncharacterized protein n=1 Tax=Stephania japonica TaxID=461633 RepID=A0AAP0DUQ0_9MAGN